MLLFMFLVGGHKSVFLGTILLIFFFYGSYKTKMKFFYLGISIVLLAAIALFSISKNLFLISHITDRVFFLPTLLDIGYFKYFDGHPIFWSDSILRSFIKYPFDLEPPYAIGLYVMGNSITHANTGIIGDGFMNLGVIGALVNILLVGVAFAILDSLNINHRFFGISFLVVTIFSSSYFFTAMITHGVLLLLISAYYFLKDTNVSIQ